MKIPLLAAAALLIGAAPSAEQFDLFCSNPKYPEGFRLRIDLAGGEWCGGECKDVEKIVSFTSGTIVLKEMKMTDQVPMETTINRVTGEYNSRWIFGRSRPDYSTAMCEPAPFSGIRTGQAKF